MKYILIFCILLSSNLLAQDAEVIFEIDNYRIYPERILIHNDAIYTAGHDNGLIYLLEINPIDLTITNKIDLSSINTMNKPVSDIIFWNNRITLMIHNFGFIFVSLDFNDVKFISHEDGFFTQYLRGMVAISNDSLNIIDMSGGIKIVDNDFNIFVDTALGYDLDLLHKVTRLDVPFKSPYIYYFSENNHIVKYNVYKREFLIVSRYEEYNSDNIKNRFPHKIELMNNGKLIVLMNDGSIFEIINDSMVKVFDARNFKELIEFDYEPPIVINYYEDTNDNIFLFLRYNNRGTPRVDDYRIVSINNEKISKIFSLKDFIINNPLPNSQFTLLEANCYFDLISSEEVLLSIRNYGIIKLSGVKSSIQETNNGNFLYFLNIFPNPASDILNVSFYSDIDIFDKVKIEIYDILGRIMMDADASDFTFDYNQGSANGKIDISTIEKGFYIVRIKNGSKSFSKTLMINR